MVKNPLANAGDAGDAGLIPGLGSSPGGRMATHSSILAWRIPWTEEPGRLQSIGSERVRHNRAHTCVPSTAGLMQVVFILIYLLLVLLLIDLYCILYHSQGSKITADADCSHEIKRHLLLGRKAMTNLDSILKSRDISLTTKVHLVKVMVFQ